MFLIKAFCSANDVMTSSYEPKWSPLQVLFFQINSLSNLNILRLVLGDWSCSENIKQDFLMISPICCFTKIAVNKWAYISGKPRNQPDYLWFSKCAMYLGLEKHMLINSADMSHLTPSATCYISVSEITIYYLHKNNIIRLLCQCGLFTQHVCLKFQLCFTMWFLPPLYNVKLTKCDK